VIKYIPGKQRVRPTYLEVLLKLPARSTCTLSIQFDYVFLKWQEYPPDASHGFYVGSAIVSAYLPLPKNYTGVPIDGSLFSSRLVTERAKAPIRQDKKFILSSDVCLSVPV